MDNRFRNIDSELNFSVDKAEMATFFDSFDDLVMDNAFAEASEAMQYPYAPAFWQNYTAQEGQIVQLVNFNEAAQNYSASYNPVFWNEAQEALASEGLHYQYKTDYWSEAEKLLVAADKRLFFKRWGAVATILLLIGFAGQLFFNNQINSESKSKSLAAIVLEKTAKKTEPGSTNIKPLTESKEVFDFQEYKPSYASKIKNENPIIIKQSSATEIDQAPGDNNDFAGVTNGNTKTNKPSQSNSSQSKGVNGPSLKNKGPMSVDQNASSKAIVVDNKTAKQINNTDIQAQKNTSITVSNYDKETRSSKGQRTIIAKINRPHVVLNPTEPALPLIEIVAVKDRNLPTVFVQAHSGIGNTFANTTGLNQRVGIDLGLTFNLKKARNFSITFQSGFDYQSLSNYINSHQIINYERNGEINHMSYGYEFDELLRWQNTILASYQLNRRITASAGLAIDHYLTSGIKVHEKVTDFNNISVKQWGRNDFINPNDFQFVGQLAYSILPRVSILANAEVGLLNQINPNKSTSIKTFRSSSLTLGVKYRPFK